MTVLYVNAHCLNLQYRDDAYRDILADADVVYCDGMGVLLAARMTGQTIPERMTGADWIEDLCRAARRHDLSLYLLGAEPEVVQGAADALCIRYPGLRIAGARDGYDVGPDTIAEIKQSRPDILLVGMGPPRQEKWIARHRAELQVPVVWAVGGLFDVVSGRVPRGPRWMTQHGLEWLFRLIVEPRRLWRRYLLGNPRFLWRVVMSRIVSLTEGVARRSVADQRRPQRPVQGFRGSDRVPGTPWVPAENRPGSAQTLPFPPSWGAGAVRPRHWSENEQLCSPRPRPTPNGSDRPAFIGDGAPSYGVGGLPQVPVSASRIGRTVRGLAMRVDNEQEKVQ